MKKYLFSTALLIFIFFLPFLISPSKITTKDNDLGRTYLPMYQDLKTSFVKYKEMPLWSGRQMMGESQIATPIPALFYPLNIIFLILPTNLAAVVYLFVHLVLSAFAVFFLARNFRLSNPASFAAAVFYSFSIKTLLHISAGHITMVAAFAYFPIMFLGISKILSNANFKSVAITAVSAALLFITHPTVFYYSILFVFTYIFYISLKNLFEKKSHLPLRTYYSVFVSILLAIYLSAISLLPYLEFNSFSNRSALKLEDIAIPVWNQKRFSQSLVFPYFNSKNFDQESFLFLGFIPTLLTVYAISKLSFLKKIVLTSFGFLTLLFVLGLSTPFFGLVYKSLPLLAYSRVTTRPWFVVILISALLSGYALDRLKNKKIAFILIALFVFESSLVFYQKLNSIPFLNFGNKNLYEFISKDTDYFRVYCTTSCFNPQLLQQYGIQILSGETPVQNANFITFLQKAGNYNFNRFAVIFPPYQVWQVESPPSPQSMLLGDANVKYVASTYEIKNPDMVFLGKFESILLYRNTNFKKKAYFLNSQDNVEILKTTSNSMSLSFEKAPDFRTLVISENYHPGFFARINAAKYRVEPFDSIFRQVFVPPNTSHIEIEYKPQSLLLGKTITLGTVFYISMRFWYSRKRKIYG